MSANYYKDGSWNIKCDLCGKKRKREEVRATYNGFMACIARCWYPKPKNEYPIPVIQDGKPVSIIRDRHVSYTTYPPITKWTDPNLRWQDVFFRWDDNQSNDVGRVFIGGEWIQT